MADLLPNIRLFKNIPVNLYTSSVPPITVGNKILVSNCGETTLRLYAQAAEPVDGDGWVPLAPEEQAVNDAGDSGAWVMSLSEDDSVNVREVS